MKLRIGLIAGLLAAGTLLQGCVGAIVGAGAGAVVSIQDRRTSGMQIEDEGIELRAANRIGEAFGDKVHINVTSFNRWVLITGEAPDVRTRTGIERIVRGVPNVRSITNEVQIAGIASFGSRSNDSLITSKVKARFLDADKFNAIHVKVVTEASVVYLMGLVTAREGSDAVDIARTTGGVRKVVKVFEYCKPTDEACRPPAK